MFYPIFPLHTIFEVLAFYFAIAYYFKLRKSEKDIFTDSQRLSLIVGAAIGALIGSRLLANIEHLNTILANPDWILITQSKTIVGGLLGGLIGTEIAKKILKITKSSGDMLTFPIILGIMIGRIGCFLTGVNDETVGLPSNLPWALDQGDGILRHPTSIYEIIFLGIIWITLKFIKGKYKPRNGDIFKFFMIAYLGWRLLVDFIKPIEPILMGLSAIQIACVIFLIYYGLIFAKRLIK